jgi:hypothetical protein
MPYVDCPGCGRSIEVYDHEFDGRVFECAQCGSKFVPVQPAPPVQVPAYLGRSVGFDCPFCHSDFPPGVRREITGGAWVLFAVLFFLCLWPICWVPLVVMRRERRYCQSCGVHLD